MTLKQEQKKLLENNHYLNVLQKFSVAVALMYLVFAL